MKTYRALIITVLATLAAACAKESNSVDPAVPEGYIKLFSHQMETGAKVHLDPDSPNGATWVAGEEINLNGTPYTIVKTGSDYYLNVGTLPAADLYAIYPASTHDAMGNDIVVVNGSDGSCSIDLRSLAVNIVLPSSKLHGGYSEEVYFPMAAHTDGSGSTLLFDHLTGGLKLTLSSSAEVSVDRLVVTAENGSHAPAIYKDIKPSWAANLLPALPTDHGQESDQSVEFVGTMTLQMNTNGSTGVAIAAGSSITFCIPMLAKALKTLTIVGYSGDSQVFSKSKTLDAAIDVERNKMYNIPQISID